MLLLLLTAAAAAAAAAAATAAAAVLVYAFLCDFSRHDEFLDETWHKFKRWESLSGICTSTSMFTKVGLSMSSATNYPLLKVKAANCRIVISWLAGFALGGKCCSKHSVTEKLCWF